MAASTRPPALSVPRVRGEDPVEMLFPPLRSPGQEAPLPPPCPDLRVARALFRQIGKDQPGFPVPRLPGQNVGKPEARLDVSWDSGQHLPVFLFPSREIPPNTERPCTPEACLPAPGILLERFL